MIKRPRKNQLRSGESGVLYEQARNNIFARSQACSNDHESGRAPSVTTIFLLQLQTSIIQVISILSTPSKPAVERFNKLTGLWMIKHAVRWSLLFSLLVLDTLAHLLGVEEEVMELSKKDSTGNMDVRDDLCSKLFQPFPNDQNAFHNHNDQAKAHDHGNSDNRATYKVTHSYAFGERSVRARHEFRRFEPSRSATLLSNPSYPSRIVASISKESPLKKTPRPRKLSSPPSIGIRLFNELQESPISHSDMAYSAPPTVQTNDQCNGFLPDKLQPSLSHHTLRRFTAQRDLANGTVITTSSDKKASSCKSGQSRRKDENSSTKSSSPGSYHNDSRTLKSA